MAAKKSSRANEDQTENTAKKAPPPKSLNIAEKGINTGQQFSALMSALMSDLLSGSVTPQIANATCNAGGKLLKMVELNLKYGREQIEGGMRNLQLIDAPPPRQQ